MNLRSAYLAQLLLLGGLFALGIILYAVCSTSNALSATIFESDTAYQLTMAYPAQYHPQVLRYVRAHQPGGSQPAAAEQRHYTLTATPGHLRLVLDKRLATAATLDSTRHFSRSLTALITTIDAEHSAHR